MQGIKQFIGLSMGSLAIYLSISGVMPPLFYLSFGLVCALVIGIIEHETFLSMVQEQVYDKHGLTKKPTWLLYIPIALINFLFWGYGITIHLLNAFDVMINRTQT